MTEIEQLRREAEVLRAQVASKKKSDAEAAEAMLLKAEIAQLKRELAGGVASTLLSEWARQKPQRPQDVPYRFVAGVKEYRDYNEYCG